MPFKGDRRLGGRRRNDSTLNGMSEGPDFPAAGTLLRQETKTYPINQGGDAAVWYEEWGVNPQIPCQKALVPIKANGLGGEYNDWANVSNVEYIADGILAQANAISTPLYVQIGDNQYENGGVLEDAYHDGAGGLYQMGGTTTYYSNGAIITEITEPITLEYAGLIFQIGEQLVTYRSDGEGYYYSQNGTPSYVPDETSVGTTGPRGLDTEVTDPENNFTFTYGYATVDEEIFSDGAGSIYVEQISIEYSTAGSLITHDEANDVWYTHDGAGGWLSGPYAPYGTPTGSTESGNVEVYIPDGGNNSYVIGSYSGAGVYWDGAGNTYSEGGTYSYDEEGTFIVNYDGYNYYCDGSGSYYSEPE